MPNSLVKVTLLILVTCITAAFMWADWGILVVGVIAIASIIWFAKTFLR